jgi:hypothetical protein
MIVLVVCSVMLVLHLVSRYVTSRPITDVDRRCSEVDAAIEEPTRFARALM